MTLQENLELVRAENFKGDRQAHIGVCCVPCAC